MATLVSSCTDEYGHLTEFGILVIVFAVIMVAIVNNKKRQQQEEAITNAVATRGDFTETKVVKPIEDSFLEANRYYLAFDDTRDKVNYVFESLNLLVDYKDIVSVEILEDGSATVSKKSASGTIGGAVLGGVLAGGVGAIVGSNLGRTTSQSQILSMKVHVLLRNNPIQSFDISCFRGDGKLDKNTYAILYKQASIKAREIFDAFKLAIDKVDVAEAAKVATVAPAQVKKSAVEELQGLSELLKQGVITEEEFSTMKERIIKGC